MKRITVLFVVLALALALFAGCGPRTAYGHGSNVSTTDNGTVNGTNPDGPGMLGGEVGGSDVDPEDYGTPRDGARTDGAAGTANGPDGNGTVGGNR